MRRSFSIILASLLLGFFGCKDDDTATCLNCRSGQTPEFELCRASNGNATVNGEDTGTDYDLYLLGLREAGVTCGGG